MKLHLYTEDLSLETLRSVQNDLSRYAHLAMYRDTWTEIIITIEERNRMSQGKTIPNITGVSTTQPLPRTNFTDTAKSLLGSQSQQNKEGN